MTRESEPTQEEPTEVPKPTPETTPEPQQSPLADITQERLGPHPTAETDAKTVAEIADELWVHIGQAIFKEHQDRPGIGGL